LPRRYLWQQKLFYIPNYADTTLFQPRDGGYREGKTILFPRRAMGKSLKADPRGLGLFLDAISIVKQYEPNIRILFVGRGHLQDDIWRWANDNGMAEKIEVMEVPLDDMPGVYQRADVVVVPSTAHEGTSLSAIEALVSGKATVVTHIGGLPNIVIDEYNGFVSDLTAESLSESIIKALHLGKPENINGIHGLRGALSKQRWEGKVWKVVCRCLPLC
jgi:glycosyltransferase involved in cell wall biosynthesis